MFYVNRSSHSGFLKGNVSSLPQDRKGLWDLHRSGKVVNQNGGNKSHH